MSSESLLLWLGLMVVLLAINAFFVAIEFALVALRPSRVQELVDAGNSTARVVQHLQENIDTSVSGAQLGITFASLALGWVVEPSIQEVMRLVLGIIPGMDGVEVPHGVALVVSLLLMSALHVVIGEQVPKCAALRLAEPMALSLARPFALYCRFAWVVIRGLDACTNACLRVMGIKKPSDTDFSGHSSGELEIIFDQSELAGEIHPRENEMLKAVFNLDELTAGQMMVPRAKMDCIDRHMCLRDAIAVASKTKHSKLPVLDVAKDTVVGVLYARDMFDLMHAYMQSGSKTAMVIVPTNTKVSRLIRPVYRIEPSMKARDLLDGMRKRNVQIAIVQDEQQRPLGLLTMEDIVEHIVGEIYDEYDKPPQPPQSTEPKQEGSNP